MTSQDSDSELAGKVAASLTPPVVHVPARRGEQSSGFFDLATLYTLRTERARPPPLPVRLPVPPRPQAVPARVPVMDDPARPVVVKRRRAARPQPIGWFAVLVTWLATTTMAMLAATQLPAHVVLRARAPFAVSAAPTAAPTVSAVAAPPAPSPAPSPSLSVAGPPVIALTDLPRALPPAQRSTRRSAPRVAPPSVPAAAATPSAPPAPAPVAVKPAPAPAPASTAGMSLDDLIRREVAAEQKRTHAAPAQ